MQSYIANYSNIIAPTSIGRIVFINTTFKQTIKVT